MAKAKKTPTKTAPKEDPVYTMPVEVRDWIEQASSRIKHLTAENERLRKEITDLKAYRRFAELKILGTSQE